MFLRFFLLAFFVHLFFHLIFIFGWLHHQTQPFLFKYKIVSIFFFVDLLANTIEEIERDIILFTPLQFYSKSKQKRKPR